MKSKLVSIIGGNKKKPSSEQKIKKTSSKNSEGKHSKGADSDIIDR